MRRSFRISFGSRGVDRDVRDEIQFYLDMRAREFEAAGLSPAVAREAARRAFGDVGRVEAACRDQDGHIRRARAREDLVESIRQDLRFAFRTLGRSPAFTLGILLTLALGIGANTAIFSLVDGVLLRPLPYGAGGRLLHVVQTEAATGATDDGFSPLELDDYRARTRTLDGVVEYHSMPFTLLGRDEPRRVQTGVVSGTFFDVLGVQPLLGRTFRPADDVPGAPPVLVLSYEFWQHAFGGDPHIVGRTFEMNDRVHTVVGVLPPVPPYPDRNDVYMPSVACPFRSGPHWRTMRAARGLTVFGRLAAGRTARDAAAELQAIAASEHAEYAAAYPAERGFATGVVSAREELTRDARPRVLLLLGAAGFLLLIVCANVANLMFARLLRRERELALRIALGAGRARLLRQLATESTLLTLLGGALGLLLAYLSSGALIAFAARFSPRAGEISIDGGVLLFTLAVSLVAGIIIGSLPALPGREALMSALRDGAGRIAAGGRHRLRGALIVSQVAVSFVLLIGAGLMLRSLLALQHVDPGFDPQHVLAAHLDLNWTKYDSGYKTIAFARALTARLRTEPGVMGVAVASTFPLNGGTPLDQSFAIQGRPTGAGERAPFADIRVVSPDYFRVLGVPLVRGRVFLETDRDTAAPVVLVNQTLARRYWGNRDPVGDRISADSGKRWIPIVGVVGDVKQYGLDSAVAGEMYVPFDISAFRDMRVLLRTRADPLALERRLRAAVAAIDPAQPVTEVTSLAQVRRDVLASPRLTVVLLGAFAALALLVTCAGIAGVVAFTIGQRTQEIGIRMALGARRGEVLAMVLRQGLGLVAVGLALGVAGALALGRLVAGLLFGVTATDPLTYAAVALVLASVAALACLGPARRATGVDPVVALRAG